MDTAWMPQVPNDFDCLTMVALMAAHTSTHRARHGRGAAAGPAPDRAWRARRCRCTPMAAGRLALGVGPSHHWIVRDMLGLPYEKPAAYTRDYLEVLNAALAGPGDGRRGERHLHRAQPDRARRRVAAAGAGRRARPGDAADRRRARRRHRAVDGRRAGDRRPHRAARSTRPPPRRAAPRRASSRASRSVCAPTPRSTRRRSGPTASWPRRRRRPTTSGCSTVATPATSAISCAAGDEEAILARFQQFADAGVTDLSVRLLPIGDTRDELVASKYRTREVIVAAAPRCGDGHESTSGPLAGIRILEVGVMLAGPYATMMLADLGAEVIKIEPPGGEISRQVSDSYFASLNRNKRSVVPGPEVRGRAARLGELRRGFACAAGEHEAVGDQAARPDLRGAAPVQRADRLRRADRIRTGRRRRPGVRLRHPGRDRRRRDDRRSRTGRRRCRATRRPTTPPG